MKDEYRLEKSVFTISPSCDSLGLSPDILLSSNVDPAPNIKELDPLYLQTPYRPRTSSPRLISPRRLPPLVRRIPSEQTSLTTSTLTTSKSRAHDGPNQRCYSSQEINVSIGLNGNSATNILQLKPEGNFKTFIREDERLQSSMNNGSEDEAEKNETKNFAMSPPLLPLCFANTLLTLYTINEFGVDCKLHLLGIDFILENDQFL